MALFGLLFLVSGASLASAPMEAAQNAYVRCLSAEADAALRQRVPPREFSEGVLLICEAETDAFRAAALPLLLTQASHGDDLSAREEANLRFTAMDEANRQKLVASYIGKLRARRGARAP